MYINSDIQNSDFLSEKESIYFETLKINKRKQSYLLGRMAAKRSLGVLMDITDYQSIEIGYGIFQFPVVRHPYFHNVQVSISHCDNIGIGLAFFEEHPMGIDIEKIDASRIDAFKTYIDEEELSLFIDCDLSIIEICTVIWTIKESLSKILKTGLMIDFHALKIKSIQK